MSSTAFNWGRAIAHNNFYEFGELGIAKSDKDKVNSVIKKGKKKK